MKKQASNCVLWLSTVTFLLVIHSTGVNCTHTNSKCSPSSFSSSTGFSCHNGRCIHSYKRCNGRDDCYDNSDESNCGSGCYISGSYDGFRCDSGECIYSSDECDGQDDCDDGSDEDDCYDVDYGLIIGLSIFFFFLFCVIGPIVLIVSIWCCAAGGLATVCRKTRPTTTVETVIPPSTAVPTVVNTSTMNCPPPFPSTAGVQQPMQQYPPPFSTDKTGYPAQYPGYRPQQIAYPPQQAGECPPSQQTTHPPQPNNAESTSEQPEPQ